MTTIALITGLFGAVVLVVLLRATPRDFGGLSELQLQRYIAYAATALEDGGWIWVRKDGLDAPIGIKKQSLKRGTRLTVQVSSGDHPRESVQAVADWLEEAGIKHRLTLSRKRKLPRWADVTLPVDDPLTPSACTHVINQMSEALGVTGDTYSVCLGGRYRYGFAPEDGEVIPHTRSYRYGRAFGYWLGTLVRTFRSRE